MPSHENHAEIKRILALDVGGTFIKSAVFEPDGDLVELPQIPSGSTGNAEEILEALRKCFSAAGNVDTVSVAIPGPFDCEAGISLMTHKFAAIKGFCLKNIFNGVPVKFLHDANAFLLGEARYGAARGFQRVGGITLGTGLGASVLLDLKPQCNLLGSPSPEVSLWNRPFRGGIAEDVISTRALLRKSGAANGKVLAQAAKSGDRNALRIWNEFGEDLALLLTDFQKYWQLETIVFGGQLSNDFELFRNPLRQLPVRRGELGSRAALYGGAAIWKGKIR